MNNNNLKSAGLSLLIGSFLMIVTMVLHPVGGDFDHLLMIVNMGIIAHSIALFSIPFVAYGYWGIMVRLQASVFLSRIGFSFMLFGLFAVMMAAALNGLVLMQFVASYADASPEVIASLKPIFRYNHFFNLANDYIFMTGVGVSTLFWSIATVKTRQFPVWIGYFGIGLVIAALLTLVTGFILTDVAGFRIFIFGTTAWTMTMGWLMFREA
ncbi:MAG: hypothetical protein R8G66_01855 [Cytophagales bacterium]|nr:hypothetical protein [Cytophagales bacterium]